MVVDFMTQILHFFTNQFPKLDCKFDHPPNFVKQTQRMAVNSYNQFELTFNHFFAQIALKLKMGGIVVCPPITAPNNCIIPFRVKRECSQQIRDYLIYWSVHY
jgi:hypothetical protein